MTRVRPRDISGPPKTAKLTPAQKREVAEMRRELVATVERCEWCGRRFSLACHEIARGCDRHKSVTQRSCILVLCNAPHQNHRQSCHSEVGVWDRAKQLALLLIRRGGDYDLEAYWRIIGRRKPEQADVDGWVEYLMRHGR